MPSTWPVRLAVGVALVSAQLAVVRQHSAPRPETSQPRVVCGMTLIPIDPNVDPKIYVEPRRGDTRYSIRAIPPPVCK
jgi:hypothetical protein